MLTNSTVDTGHTFIQSMGNMSNKPNIQPKWNRLLCNYRYNSLQIVTLQNMQETRVDKEVIVT